MRRCSSSSRVEGRVGADALLQGTDSSTSVADCHHLQSSQREGYACTRSQGFRSEAVRRPVPTLTFESQVDDAFCQTASCRWIDSFHQCSVPATRDYSLAPRSACLATLLRKRPTTNDQHDESITIRTWFARQAAVRAVLGTTTTG